MKEVDDRLRNSQEDEEKICRKIQELKSIQESRREKIQRLVTTNRPLGSSTTYFFENESKQQNSKKLDGNKPHHSNTIFEEGKKKNTKNGRRQVFISVFLYIL